MVSPAIGKVVLVPFPFSDLSNSKLRPAAILANAGRRACILCQITSNPYGDPYAIALIERSFVEGPLSSGVARLGKLFTASGGLIVNEVGILSDIKLQGIVSGVIAILQGRDDSKTA